VLLVTNLSLIVAIPIVWLLWVTAHGMRPGWSSSVLARLRWRLLAPLTLRALATLGVGICLSVGLGFAFGETEVTGPVDDLLWLLLVVVLTTPLQSAAEEYVFRGYLSQAITGWLGPRARRGGPPPPSSPPRCSPWPTRPATWSRSSTGSSSAWPPRPWCGSPAAWSRDRPARGQQRVVFLLARHRWATAWPPRKSPPASGWCRCCSPCWR
jgi:hypothetical protein